MSEGRLIALGSINVDFQARVERLPQSGELVLGKDFMLHGGGKAANVAFIAKRLGVPVRLIGRVGRDALAGPALDPLQAAGIDLDHVRAVEGESTAAALIAVPSNGDKAIILASNANDAWNQDDAEQIASAIQECGAGSVLVADLEVPVFIVRRAIEVARECGYRVILDPSPPDRTPHDLYAALDYIVPDHVEAEHLTGISVDSADDAIRAGRILVERGVRVALVKLRDGGSAVVSAGSQSFVPPYPVTVVDTTGAGDAFAGALGTAVFEKQPLLDAARFAVGAASIAVSRYGSQPAYPSREELNRLLESNPAS